MTDYDHGYKRLFSHPEMVRDLLLGFVREDWVSKLDFDSLEKVAASYVSDDLRERHDDVIWRVRFAGEWLSLYILLEFQSSEDRFMAVRILSYLGLFHQDLINGKQLTQAGRLPPVLPVVLYNGEPRWKAATDVFDLIENIPGSLAKFSPRLKYLLIDEGAYDQTELESLRNLVSALFQLEKTPLVELGEKIIKKLLKWIGDNRELQRSFAVFLNRVCSRENVEVVDLFEKAEEATEVSAMLERNVALWREQLEAKGEARGRVEGEARGRAEERQRLAGRLLATGLPVSQVAEVTELSEEDIQRLLD